MQKINNEKKYNLSIISQYRGALFGLSIISIIVFHYFNDVMRWRRHDVIYKMARIYYQMFGSISVEIFLFLSGVGLYFSMSKNPDIKFFYEKRLKRVAIPYVLWGVFYWAFRDFLLTGEEFGQYVSDLTLFSFWETGKRTFWFIAFILLAYLAFPFLFRMMNREIKGRHAQGLICALICVVWVAFCSLLDLLNHEHYDLIEVALSRLPIFVIGIWYGKKIRNKEKFGAVENILTVFGLALIALKILLIKDVIDVDFKLHNRFLACFFSISLLFLLCCLLERLHSAKLNKVLTFIGTYSLELYLTHVSIRGVFMLCGIRTHRLIILLSYLLLSAVFSFLLHLATEKIIHSGTVQK